MSERVSEPQEDTAQVRELTPAISAIIPIRNRSGERLANCLRSLRWQEGVAPEDLEVVLVDYGSDPAHRDAVAREAEGFGARVVRVEAGGLWNRSRALNYGLRAARGEYLLCTDVDMIFSPRFIAELLSRHRAAPVSAPVSPSVSPSVSAEAGGGRGKILFSRCLDLPESVGLARWERGDYERLRDLSSERPTQGTGACQCAHREFFMYVRGYDEGFEHWGAEDDDMRSRALRYGLTPEWVSPVVTMLHQWHPTTKDAHPWRRRLNKWRLYLTRWRVRKNAGGWGGGAP